MGTIDKATHQMKCPNCDAAETVTIRETGSNWGTSWETPPKTKSFIVEWAADKFGEPRPVASKCRECKVDAVVTSGR